MARAQPREVELKLELAPDDLERLRGHPLLAGDQPGAGREQALDTVYYDTETLAVRRCGLTLRVRRSGDRHVQTVKTDGAGAGMFDRGEWERDIAGAEPDLDATADTPLRPVLDDPALRRDLKPVFQTHVERSVYTLDDEGWAVEVTFDRGRVEAGARSAPLCELELELKRGAPGDLFRLASRLAEAVPLRLGARSKSERGYALLRDEPPAAVKAAPVDLRPDMTTAAAFQEIGRACLRQFALNAPVLLETGDADALHQMRVALRRFRAALSLFKPLLVDGRLETVKAELKWAAGELGDARDLDVFLARTLAKARKRHADETGFAALEAHFRDARAAAYDRALAAARSPRFGAAAVEAAGWLEAGDWLRADDAEARRLRAQPIADTAADVLRRRRRKLRKRGRRLAELDDHDRHRLRIQVKKLRYATQFFAGLYDHGKAAKRRDAFMEALEDLQDHLGALNDLAVGRARLEAVTRAPETGAGEGRGLRRSFAAGVVAGAQSGRADRLLKAATKAYDGVAEAKAFWS